MTEQQQIYARLSAHAGLTALVGTRISLARALQASDFPCVTYQRISGGRRYDHDGIEPMSESVWQFDCYAKGDMNNAIAVADQLRLALNASESPLIGWYCFIDNETYDDNEVTTLGVFRVMIQCTCWLRRSTA